MHTAVQEALEKAKQRADQAEVYRVERRETPVSFEANRLKMLETKESSGMALRIVRDGRIGFSATNDAADIDGLVERAVELADFGAAAKFDLPGPETYAGVPVYDPKIEDVSIEEMVRTGQTMIDALRERHDDLVCEAGVTRAVGAVEIANSTAGAPPTSGPPTRWPCTGRSCAAPTCSSSAIGPPRPRPTSTPPASSPASSGS